MYQPPITCRTSQPTVARTTPGTSALVSTVSVVRRRKTAPKTKRFSAVAISRPTTLPPAPTMSAPPATSPETTVEITARPPRTTRRPVAEAREQRADDPDREGDAAPVQGAAAQLVADDRELGERRVDDFAAQFVVAGEDVAEDRGQQQQQREEREEGAVGDQRDHAAAFVVAELLHDAERQPQGRSEE